MSSSASTWARPSTGPPPWTGTGGGLHDRALAGDEARLRGLYERLSRKGHLLVVVGRPATIGGVAVARDTGIAVGYLPGVSMRRIADLTPGERQD